MVLDDGVNVTAPPEDLSELTVDELQDRLRARDLRVSGTKDELIDRLRDAG